MYLTFVSSLIYSYGLNQISRKNISCSAFYCSSKSLQALYGKCVVGYAYYNYNYSAFC